jgi:uncharacterized protein
MAKEIGLREAVALGIGGMIGGGIFSVLGLSVEMAGHASYFAFLVGGLIAAITGYSYAKLGVRYESDGGSFTYLEKAFPGNLLPTCGGWLLLVGYVATLSLYAFAFGAYGASLFSGHLSFLQHAFSSAVIIAFVGINLVGAKEAGISEDLIVGVKLVILMLFTVAGLFFIQRGNLVPVFDTGISGTLMGAALIFVAYEGFELIPNSVKEMKDPAHTLPRAIYIAIGFVVVLYVLVALVAVGNLPIAQLVHSKDYALAVAARPFLGQAGFVLIAIAALLSTASAINATLFGTARLGAVMATDRDLPKMFSLREKTKDVPWASLVALGIVTLLFVNIGSLTAIASASSAIFLTIFFLVNLAHVRLYRETGGNMVISLIGAIFCFAALTVLCIYLYEHNRSSLLIVGVLYAITIALSFLFVKEVRERHADRS